MQIWWLFKSRIIYRGQNWQPTILLEHSRRFQSRGYTWFHRHFFPSFLLIQAFHRSLFTRALCKTLHIETIPIARGFVILSVERCFIGLIRCKYEQKRHEFGKNAKEEDIISEMIVLVFQATRCFPCTFVYMPQFTTLVDEWSK